jgi:hypothetical protein
MKEDRPVNNKSGTRSEETEENILSFLSFAASDTSLDLPFTPNFRTMSGAGSGRRRMQPASTSMQGVLWKRRDVFRNRWRPRWFVLHPQQGILTYYLLNGNSHPTATASTESPPNTPAAVNRRRADSDISLDTIDYDVVPRGSIYLGNASCMVEANESLTRPEERLYALTISDRDTGMHCHLACRSSTARDRWLDKIQEAITQHQIHTSQRSGIASGDYSQSVEPLRVPAAAAVPTLQEESKENATAEEEIICSVTKWTTVASADLTSGIPPPIVAKIDSLLETHLPYATEISHPDFKFAYDEEGVQVSSHKALPILRSTYSVKDHHPAEYLQLLWDFSQAPELEPNVRTQESLRALNKNTSIVHTVYHSMWPTRPRDLCSVAHWRLIENSSNKDTALCLLAFSCPEANKLQPTQDNHVRGTLSISLHVLRPLEGGGCSHTRILSFDMNGNMPKQLKQAILQQQTTLPPRAMDFRLRQMKLEARASKATPVLYRMDYDTMIRATKYTGSHRKPELRHGESVVISPSCNATVDNIFALPQNVSVLTESLVLLAPICSQPLLSMVGLPRLEMVVLCVMMVWCIRWVLMQHLHRHFHLLPPGTTRQLWSRKFTEGTTVCHVTLNTKESLAFLANERNAKIALGEDELPQVEFCHVLLRSISKAIQKHPSLVTRSFPFLPPLYNLDMHWHTSSSNDSRVWIPSTEQYSIQAIANCFACSENLTSQLNWWPRMAFVPACRIWTHLDQGVGPAPGPAPETKNIFSHVADASDFCPISVAVYPAATTRTGKKSHVQRNEYASELSISFQSTDVESCRLFVEEVLMSIQVPELCDA